MVLCYTLARNVKHFPALEKCNKLKYCDDEKNIKVANMVLTWLRLTSLEMNKVPR